MKSFKKKTKHLLRVMLCESLELNSPPGNHVLDIPWCNIRLITYVKIIQQISECNRQSPSCPKGVPLIYVIDVALEDEVFG